MQTHSASSRFHVSQRSLGSGISRIDEHGHTSGAGHQLTQQFQPLCRHLGVEKIDSCQVAARPGEAGDKSEPDRVFGDDEHDGDRRGRRLGRQCRSEISGGDHRDLSANQFGRQRRQSIELSVGRAIFDRHVLALGEANVFEALAKPAHTVRNRVRRCGVEEPDHRHRWLLRPRRERPPAG